MSITGNRNKANNSNNKDKTEIKYLKYDKDGKRNNCNVILKKFFVYFSVYLVYNVIRE